MLVFAIENTIGAAVLAVVAFVLSRVVKRPGTCSFLWLLVLVGGTQSTHSSSA